MNKSSILLLPTVLAVSSASRSQSANANRRQSIDPINRPAAKNHRTASVTASRKPLSIDFVFSVSK
jgi:hypothetical protein